MGILALHPSYAPHAADAPRHDAAILLNRHARARPAHSSNYARTSREADRLLGQASVARMSVSDMRDCKSSRRVFLPTGRAILPRCRSSLIRASLLLFENRNRKRLMCRAQHDPGIVGTGFPSRQTPKRVCAEIMVKQQPKARRRFDLRQSSSSPAHASGVAPLMIAVH